MAKMIDADLIKAWEKQLERYGEDESVFFLGKKKFTKKDILEHLKKEDDIGVKIAQMSHRLTIDLLMRGKIRELSLIHI